MIRLRSPQDLVAGLCALALAGLALWQIGDMRMGTAFRMGPAFIPTGLSAVIGIFGAAIAVSAFAVDGKRLERWAWRSIAIVGAAILFFAAAIETLGLFVTTFVLTLGAAYAEPRTRFVPALLFAAGAAVFAVLVFPLALRVGISMWPRL